jgi:hypothetical protein
VLGFCALIAGALFNYRLNRRRDAGLRHEEIVSIAAALYGEIVTLRESTAKAARIIAQRYLDYGLGRERGEPFDKHLLETLVVPPSDLYLSLAPRIGMLPSDLTLQVVSFYSTLEEVRLWVPRLEGDEARGYSYSVLSALKPALAAIDGVRPALRKIEAMAGIASRAEEPDVGRARDVAEMEEDSFAAVAEGR